MFLKRSEQGITLRLYVDEIQCTVFLIQGEDMKKKIKSAVISIVVIAVLLLAILIGVKNGTIDKLTKEMPTLATSQTETEKSAVNVNRFNRE